jgi:hypothetical protein
MGKEREPVYLDAGLGLRMREASTLIPSGFFMYFSFKDPCLRLHPVWAVTLCPGVSRS